MKKNIKTLIISPPFLLITLALSAQTKLREGISITSGKHAYHVGEQSKRLLSVRTKNADLLDSLVNTGPAVRLDHVEFLNNYDLNSAFIDAFGKQKLQSLLPERNLMCNVYFNAQGAITDVSFLIRQNTALTTEDIAQLESTIKRKVRVFVPEELKDKKVFRPIFQNMLFSKLLNMTK